MLCADKAGGCVPLMGFQHHSCAQVKACPQPSNAPQKKEEGGLAGQAGWDE